MTDGVGQGARPSFGFADLTPDPAPPAEAPAPDLRAADAVADRHGFGSREAPVRRRKRQPLDVPTDQLNLRASIADINRFVEWCERKRMSYREGFAELVKGIRD